VPIEQGPLAIVEGSHRFDDLVAATRKADVVGEPYKRAALTDQLVDFARSRGARLLTIDFEPGDVLIFGMTTFHAGLDNHTPDAAIRLSFDLRIQAADAPRDERYFGADPIGITGRGYAELNGARPLGQPWHQR
jgi:ectoine hydroxylase-related dioxygenase (phytanoyl-CoA dioxygenase family)